MYGHAHLLAAPGCPCGGPGVVRLEDGSLSCGRCYLESERATTNPVRA